MGGIFGFLLFRLLQKLFARPFALLSSLVVLFSFIGLTGILIINTHYGYLLNFSGFSQSNAKFDRIHNNLEILGQDPSAPDYECVFTSYENNLLTVDLTSNKWGRIGTEQFQSDENTKVVSCLYEIKDDQVIYTYAKSSIAAMNGLEKDTPLCIWLADEASGRSMDTVLFIHVEK